MQDIPTGDFVRRQEGDEFKPMQGGSRFGRLATEWLQWVANENNKSVQHKLLKKQLWNANWKDVSRWMVFMALRVFLAWSDLANNRDLQEHA